MTRLTNKIVKAFQNPRKAAIYLSQEMLNYFFRLIPYDFARFIEGAAAAAQGKGTGAMSIQQENEIIHRLIQNKPKLAVDIGGNVGEYTAELRRRNLHLEIHTFEPSTTNIRKLNDRFSSDGLITIVPLAVSNQAGSATLFSDRPGSGLGSLTQRKLDHINIEFNNEQAVSTIRFEDYWINQLNCRKLDIVKIDIEGHELDALQGFGAAIDHMVAIQFEFGGCNIDTRTFFQDFWNFFNKKEFDIFRITPTGTEHIRAYREIDEFFSTTNYIAINRNLL